MFSNNLNSSETLHALETDKQFSLFRTVIALLHALYRTALHVEAANISGTEALVSFKVGFRRDAMQNPPLRFVGNNKNNTLLI